MPKLTKKAIRSRRTYGPIYTKASLFKKNKRKYIFRNFNVNLNINTNKNTISSVYVTDFKVFFKENNCSYSLP